MPVIVVRTIPGIAIPVTVIPGRIPVPRAVPVIPGVPIPGPIPGIAAIIPRREIQGAVHNP
jgi:hypothetical protein